MDAPSGNASRDDWAAYATDQGAPEEETRPVEEGGLTRDALRSKYTVTEVSGKVVKYIGTADVREIEAADWKNVGADGQKKVVWDKSNNWTVSADSLSAEALRYCDEKDDGLVVGDA